MGSGFAFAFRKNRLKHAGMQKPRARGLNALHGMVVLFWLPILFVVLIYANKLLRPEMLVRDVNFPLYIYMLFISGLVFMGFRQDEVIGEREFRWVASLKRTNLEVIIVALGVFLVVFATKDRAVSRLFLGSYLVSSWMSLLFINRYFTVLLSRLAFNQSQRMRVLLVGSSRLARLLRGWIREQDSLGIEIVGLVSFSEEEAEKELEGLQYLGLVENLEPVIEKEGVDQVVILESKDSLGWVTFITRIAELYGCRILVYNQWEEFFNQPLIPFSEGSHTFFTFQEEPLENPINRVMKRGLDLAVSIPVVIFLLPPILLLAMLFQRLQSPGALFFKQERGGRRGESFEIFKIRTMHVRPDEEAKQATKEDPRIFPFGKLMRKTSLDEFPQFLNVLFGQMSVVGPRPHMVEHDDRFSRLVDVYRNRHFIKPGITGLAQIRGFRGEVTDSELIAERVRYDLEYISRWSIWLDIGIILKTVLHMIRPPKTAY